MKRERPEITAAQLKEELHREKRRAEYRKTLRGTVYILLIVAAVAVLATTLFFPVLQVTGTSMEPTLEPGQIVLAVKNGKLQEGDVVAFYYNNKILLKRFIGQAGDQIEIDDDGNVSINTVPLEEPYLAAKSLGECDLEFPYQVPDGKIFVLGDHRATSVDSRSDTVGCIDKSVIVGKVIVKIWPWKQIGMIQ